MRNTVEKKDNVIIKSFGSRMDFARETGVYARLGGSDLAPELLSQYDGRLEHVYVEGPTFLESYAGSIEDQAALAALFESFFTWYVKYKELTNLILGKVDLNKFIISDTGLKYIDFEHCRPGYSEQDIAAACSALIRYPSEFGSSSVKAAKLFICVGSSFMKWRPELLEKYLTDELGRAPEARSFINSAVCSGIILADKADISSAAVLAAAMPQRLIYPYKGVSAACPGFENVTVEAGGAEGFRQLLRKSDQPYTMLINSSVETEPYYADVMLAAMEDGTEAVIFTEKGQFLTSPVLLRTAAAAEVLSSASSASEIIPAITEKLKIKILNVEDLK